MFLSWASLGLLTPKWYRLMKLVRRLADLARSAGCYGMWVGTEDTNISGPGDV